jgi:hypothetical protein
VASLGEITVGLRAEVAPLRQGMSEAAEAVARTSAAMDAAAAAASARLTEAMTKAGRAAGAMDDAIRKAAAAEAEFAAQVAAANRPLDQLARGMTEAARNPPNILIGGMSRAGQAAREMAEAVRAAGEEASAAPTKIGRLENAVTNLGLGLAGVNGPLGSVADKLAGFAGYGGLFAIAAVAAGGLVAYLRSLSAAAAETAEKVRAAADAVVFLRDTEERATRRRVAELRTLRESLREQLVSPGGPYGPGFGERLRESINRFQAGLRPVKAVREELVRVNADLVRAEAALIAIQDRGTKAVDDQTAAWSKLSGAMIQAQQTAVEAAAVPAFLLGQRRPMGDTEAPGYTTETNPAYTPTILLGARQREQIVAKVAEDAPAWQRVGVQLGDVIGEGLARGLAASLLRGAKGLGDVLKNIFLEIMETILVEVIRPFAKKIGQTIANALSGGGGALFGAGIVGTAVGIVGGLFGFARAAATQPPGVGTVIVPTSAIPPNPNPLAVARDAQWQALFGETARVAERGGLRLVFA